MVCCCRVQSAVFKGRAALWKMGQRRSCSGEDRDWQVTSQQVTLIQVHFLMTI